ncbi:PREDICTED: major histocompatibility complex class I-related gene protein-like [Nanorana parkeri]|uniref:major histocompatibility complex class I-related gene protein-like n=1 Tax=Nanorana parkeri TaxID=125878 RepID=UPI0008549C68|nr:PREDICTED: major histocompatibility complex class I-related gene protein-like [Nanorana parkeri]
MWSPKRSTPPHTEVTVSLDDVPILKYSSTNHELQLLFNWLENVDSGHWKALEKTAKYYVVRHQHTIKRLHPSQDDMDSYVFQVKFGCYIYEDNSTSGEEEFGVNGRDFIFLDNEKKKFMASAEEGKFLAREWNRRPNSAQRQFHYKDVACVQWMRIYLNIKTDNFTKTVRPGVKVWGRISDEEITRLHCLVYGFHPKDVIVKWVRNGVDDVPSDEMSPILPHPDGTYQIRVSVEEPTRDGDTYSCYVEHSSLEEPLNVYLELWVPLLYNTPGWGRKNHSTQQGHYLTKLQ